ncbi:MAG: FHA domain-containing protein [Planctomycetes bacterium]|nr:FHA domain-containing protein [Planctomycetota bacterium]
MSGKDEAYLIVLNGPLKGGVFVLSKISVFEIGRGDGCHIKLPDEYCGFNHARISVRRGEWRFTNLNEERGSSINDIKVDSRVLEGFEVIRVGKTELQFTLEAPGKQPAPASGTASEPRSVGVAPQMLAPEPAESGTASVRSATPPAPKIERMPRPAAQAPKTAAPTRPPASSSRPAAAPPPPRPRVANPASPPKPPKPTRSAPVKKVPPASILGRSDAVFPNDEATLDPGPGLLDSSPSTPTPHDASDLAPSRTEHFGPGGLTLDTDLEVPESSRGYRIKVIDGCDADLGREVDFLQGTTCIIGRSVSSDFVLGDGKISRAHCSIELKDGVLVLCDLDSSNGTVVNGERIQKTVIKPGDYIRLGFTVLGCEEIELPVA